MTYEELLAATSAPKEPLLRALWLVRRGDWNGAHDIVTDMSEKMASRIHAHLHRVEGDISNAHYWYRQAKVSPSNGSLESEWEELARDLTR